MPTIQFTLSKTEGKHFAKANGGNAFYVGTETVYKGQHGLFNLKISDGPVYKAEDYVQQFGHWAWFLLPTAKCESNGSFHCLNTYDRAAFTFTFMQFAAHVPNGDFVQWFRALLQLPEAKDYFPFLELRNNRIFYVRNNEANQLEKDGPGGTAELMKYLNNDIKNIDSQEIITAARFVHWAQNSAAHRQLQVATAVKLFKGNMHDHSRRFNLDGMPDYICHVICDIFHQGRAKYNLVSEILSNNSQTNAYNKLLNIGAANYADRIRVLKATHKLLRDTGKFGKVYNAASGEFS